MSLANLGTLLSGILILIIGLRVYQLDREKRIGVAFLSVCILYSWMCVMWYELGQTTNLEKAALLRQMQGVWAFSIPLLTLCFFLFAKSYKVEFSRFFPLFLGIFLILPGAYFFYLEWFTPFHHGRMEWVETQGYWGIALDRLDGYALLRGAWTTLNFALSVIFAFLAFHKSNGKHEKAWLLIIFMVMLISYSNTIYLNYISPLQGIVLPANESFACLVSCFLFGWAFSDYQLLEINHETAMENIVNSMTNWLILMDEDMMIKEVNPAVVNAYGIPQNDLQNVYLPQLAMILDDEAFKEEIIDLLKKGDKMEKEMIFDVNGSIRTIEMTTTPILDHWGNRKGFSLIGHDITAYKAAQEQILDYAADLEYSNEALEHFAHIASHDLKEPLRTIGAFTSLIEKRLDTVIDQRTREYFRFVKEGAGRMNDMISGILKYSKIRGSNHVAQKIDVNKMLVEIQASLNVLIKEKGAEITCDLLPVVEGDKAQVNALFQNLIQNGIKYNLSEKPLIHISTYQKNNDLVFSFKDNGIGIPAKHADQIFKMFHRLHGPSDIKGTGIGLAICSRIIERHGGRIWVESEEGVGSTFKIAWPMERVLALQPAPSVSEQMNEVKEAQF